MQLWVTGNIRATCARTTNLARQRLQEPVPPKRDVVPAQSLISASPGGVVENGWGFRPKVSYPPVLLPMNMIPKSWPRSAYLTITVLALSLVVVTYFVYTYTREAYRSVGFNDGQIYQQEQLMQSIRKSVRMHECDDYKGMRSTKFLSVKAETINALIAEDGSVRFCE